jgi:hypothetical protein
VAHGLHRLDIDSVSADRPVNQPLVPPAMFDPYAVALDFRVMARDAHMRVPEIGLGTRINLALTSVARATIIDL